METNIIIIINIIPNILIIIIFLLLSKLSFKLNIVPSSIFFISSFPMKYVVITPPKYEKNFLPLH